MRSELHLFSFDKKTSEIVDHGHFFKTQKYPAEYYFSATDPYRVYMLSNEDILVCLSIIFLI